MSWLSRFLLANWSILMDCLLLAMAMIIGVQLGEVRVQSAWNAEKSRVEQVVAKQEQHIEDVKLGQAQINQEISNDFLKKSKLLASRLPDTIFDGVCNNTAPSGSALSDVPTNTEAIAQSSADPLLAASGDERGMSCERLADDAAQTTLMLLEFQKWAQTMHSMDLRN